MKENWEFATRSIHSGVGPETKLGATTPPIYQSSAFGYDTAEELSDVFQGRGFGYIYSRVANPTVSVIEQRVNALEQGRGALAAASGMAAIATTIFALTRSGDEIIAGKSLFGGTLQLFSDIFENYGVQVVYVDSCDVAGYRKAISSRTRLIFLETIGNPQLDVPDLKQIATVAAEYEIPLVVDSTLTTPYLLFAKEFGVNIVIHSTSKYIQVAAIQSAGSWLTWGTLSGSGRVQRQCESYPPRWEGLLFWRGLVNKSSKIPAVVCPPLMPICNV